MSDRAHVVMFHSSEYRGDHSADTCTPIAVDPSTSIGELVAMFPHADWRHDRLELRPLLSPEEWKARQ